MSAAGRPLDVPTRRHLRAAEVFRGKCIGDRDASPVAPAVQCLAEMPRPAANCRRGAYSDGRERHSRWLREQWPDYIGNDSMIILGLTCLKE
jgi:hypothetical protein